MARGTGFSMQKHALFGKRIKQIRADIKSLTDEILIAYPSPNNSFANNATRQLDRARACLEKVRGTAEGQMMREYPYSYDIDAYRGEASSSDEPEHLLHRVS